MTNEETEEKLRRLAPLNRDFAHKAWLYYLSGEAEERQDASDLFDILLHQNAGKSFERGIFLDPPPPTQCDGSYRLGNVMYPPGRVYAPFGLREEDWIRHVLIVGMTGMGKTNLAFQMLRSLAHHGKPFLVFDWKRSYRKLRTLPELSDIAVHTVGSEELPFRFNPLIPPPGVDPGHWLMKLVDVMKHAYFVGDGVEYLLRRGLDWAYERCGWFDTGADRKTPTFQIIRAFMQKFNASGRTSLWKASTMRVLESLCFRHGLGPVMNTDETLDPDRFFASRLILELDPLSDVDKVFVTEALTLWIYEWRKLHGPRNVFSHAILIEEGHHVLSEAKERAQGTETIMETCLRQIREFGEAVIVIDQEPSKLSNSIRANTNTKICFNLGNGEDLAVMAGDLGMAEQDREAIGRLEVGQAVVTVKERIVDQACVVFAVVR